MILSLVVLGIALGLFLSAGAVGIYELVLWRRRRAIRRAAAEMIAAYTGASMSGEWIKRMREHRAA